jgi:hypothetical protein
MLEPNEKPKTDRCRTVKQVERPVEEWFIDVEAIYEDDPDPPPPRARGRNSLNWC